MSGQPSAIGHATRVGGHGAAGLGDVHHGIGLVAALGDAPDLAHGCGRGAVERRQVDGEALISQQRHRWGCVCVWVCGYSEQ